MKPLPGLSIETHGPENLGWAGRKTTARLNAKSSDRPKTIRRTQCVACYASELEWLGTSPNLFLGKCPPGSKVGSVIGPWIRLVTSSRGQVRCRARSLRRLTPP